MSRAKHWRLCPKDAEKVNKLALALQVEPLVAQLLINRHIDTVIEGQRFLSDTLDKMGDPFQLKDMTAAVSRICTAITEQQLIVIYGDYDVDGISATALVYRLLQKLGAKLDYYIPERQSEGYGLNKAALELLISRKTVLLITVDCGISSYDEVAAVARQLDIIITDHHEPPYRLPPAFAIINPKQPDCPYKDKNLAGVGVAYKLCQGLWQTLRGEKYTDDLELVALGTVADVVALVGENRIIVKYGLARIAHTTNKGLAALVEVVGLKERKITAGRVGFVLAPRLNASGRVGHATEGVRLLTTEDDAVARTVAAELNDANSDRQEIEKSIMEAVQNKLNKKDITKEKVLIVAGENWHSGVIGIVASRLVEAYYKPALVISLHDGIGKGSCRSIKAFDLHGALAAAADVLIQFGGHHQAAGFSIEEKNIPLLRERLTAYADHYLTDADYIPQLNVDDELSLSDITLQLLEKIACLEPYGMGNPTPVFAGYGLPIKGLYPIGKDKNHLRVQLEKGYAEVDGVGWNMAEYAESMYKGDSVNVAFTMEVNEYKGICRPQLILQDMTVATHQSILLNRDILGAIYKGLRHELQGHDLPAYRVESALGNRFANIYTKAIIMAALQVFREIGLLVVEMKENEKYYRLLSATGKLDLAISVTYLQYSKGE